MTAAQPEMEQIEVDGWAAWLDMRKECHPTIPRPGQLYSPRFDTFRHMVMDRARMWIEPEVLRRAVRIHWGDGWAQADVIDFQVAREARQARSATQGWTR